MFATKTVLVLGAGSSFDFGMPLGSELIEEIKDALQVQSGGNIKDELVAAQFLKEFEGSDEELMRAANLIREVSAGFQSIDDLLDFHRKDVSIVRLGKLAIARIIAAREAKCPITQLWNPEHLEAGIEWASRTWVRDLVSIAITGFRNREISEIFKDITIVNFNYDRCAESMIYALVKSYARLSDNETVVAIENLKIFHPYGSLGPLPYDRANPGLFGDASPDIGVLADGILLYTEEAGERPDLDGLQNAVLEAATIVMIGFGFHTQNIRLMVGDDPDMSDGKIFASVIGEGPYAVPHIQERLGNMIRKSERSWIGATDADVRDIFSINRRVFQG